MKYSIGVIPSFIEEITGNSSVSPRVLGIRPFIPIICAICRIEPRAPDFQRSYADPFGSICSGMSSSSLLFVRCQISISIRRRSSRERRPCSKCSMITRSSSRAEAITADFSLGTITSSIPHVVPETVAYLKPNFLILLTTDGTTSTP